MRIPNAEIMKNQNHEAISLKDMLQEAKGEVTNAEMKAAQAEEEARSLELELLAAQAAKERREEAERQGKETKEKITEATG